jgi:hypothetical protein
VLAAAGHTSEQIAEKLGYSGADSLRATARKQGIEIPADRVVGRTLSIDHDRIVNETVHGLEGAVMGLELLDLTQIKDRSEIGYWVSSLSDSLRFLNRFHRQLKEMTQ